MRTTGQGVLKEVGALRGEAFKVPVVGRGAAYADYDRDGDQDILLLVGGGAPVLMENKAGDSQADDGIRVILEGRQSNRNGIGARVVVYADSVEMVRRVKTGSSYLSQSELTLTFGLGKAGQVDSLAVWWPSGVTSKFAAVPAGHQITIVEGEDVLASKTYQGLQ